MGNFDTRYPNARATTGKPGWRAGLRSISPNGLDYLAIDDEGRLYWDNQPIKVASYFELSEKQGIGAVIVVVSALSLACFDALRFFGLGSN